MKALQIASTGMMAQELNVEVISNNIANMRTTGFKEVRAEFQDLLYEDIRQVGASSSETGTIVPTGIQVGYGVKTAATTRIMSQGNLQNTEKELDIAIRGEGFFAIQLPSGQTGYTRDGSFERDGSGNIVTLDGYLISPNINIPATAKSVTINRSGVVQATLDGQTTPSTIGQIQLTRFVNKGGLQAVGDNLYLETPASGSPVTANPDSTGFGSVLQKYLESSNVNAVKELSDLIAAQRAYEMNAKIISAADEMMQASHSMIR